MNVAWYLQHKAQPCNGLDDMRKLLILTMLAFSPLVCSIPSRAQNSGEYDVFIPIAKYFGRGDAERLSAWFADNLEVSIFSSANEVSHNQARRIMKSFFDSYSPRSFTITHAAGRGNMKYALGSMNAGGENFRVTIFVNRKGQSYYIQQLKIEKTE